MFKVDLFKIIDYLLHLGLMSLGFYFIYQGNIWERFQQKRTNFAEYDESIGELPAIVSWIRYSKSGVEPVALGHDFHIYYSEQLIDSAEWTKYELLKGKNNMSSGLELKLDIEKDWFGNNFRVTPTSVPSGISDKLKFRLNYRFDNQTLVDPIVSEVKISLASINNSHCAWGWTPYDGDIAYIFAKPGESIKLSIEAQKYIYNPERENCRMEPYNDMVIRRVLANMETRCPEVCRPHDYWICNFDLQGLFTVCNSSKLQCFWDEVALATEGIVEKPCTKLQYKVDENRNPHYTHIGFKKNSTKLYFLEFFYYL